MKKRLFSILLCSVLLLSLVMAVRADSTPTSGKLNVRVRQTGTNNGVYQAIVYIYQVASVSDNRYVLTPTFASSGFDVTAIGEMTAAVSEAEAKKLASFVTANSIRYTNAKKTNSSGNVNFDPVNLGLYLVVEDSNSTGYKNIAPFLISIPQKNGDAYVYDVVATPKMGTADRVTQPTTAPTTRPTTRPTTPSGALPKTGQLWWPVYVMVACGLTCFAVGWVRRKRGADE